MRTERELLVDCLTRLNQSSIPYMLVGSMATNYWGIPRSSHDLDFVLALRAEEIAKFESAFREGYFLQPQAIRNALLPPHQFNLIDEHSALKVDFWLQTNDPFDVSRFARRQQVFVFQTPAWISTAEDLILQKLRWNKITPSERQLTDAAGVYVVQLESLDADYLRQWGDSLGVQEELRLLMTGKILPKAT